MDWNVIVTVHPGHGHEHRLLDALRQFGRFRGTAFRDVCMGRVDDVGALLEALRVARDQSRPWLAGLGRVIPVEAVFAFSPETLAERLKEAVAPLVERMTSGSCYVRLERRGFEGKIQSPEIERQVADHLFAVASGQGKTLRADFRDPDYIVAAEMLGEECGVGLLPRDMRARFPFVQTR